jgi:hypothetical protein
MNWLINHPQLVLLTGFAYEVVVRVIPTTMNLSIIDKFKTGMLMAHNLFDIIVPNKRIDEE